jgi:hypothetical protein
VIISTWRDTEALDRFRGSTLRTELSTALEVLREFAKNTVLDTVASYEGNEKEAG